MTTLHMGSQLWVLINTDRAATDIISLRSTITSERPHMPVSSGLVSNGKRSVIQESATWKEARRLMRQLLTGPTTQTFTEWQDLESVQMLLSYLHEPKGWWKHQSRYATAVLYGVVTGERLSKTDAQMAEYRKITMEFLGSLFATTVDFFPILELLPQSLQPWRKYWKSVGESHRHVFKSWWHPIKAKVDDGTAKPSWVRDVVLNPHTSFKGGEEEALYLTNSVISAGGDNPRMTLNTFVMASIHCPSKFQKCRQEIDIVCGSNANRLPGVEDISSMPYLCAFIKEVLRWRPIVPLVPPHQLTEELEYGGFVFPKKTNFIINTIAVSADCDQPEEFLPERWLDGNEANLTHGFWGFGGGRRVCIGYKAAQPGLFLAVSRLIYCFDFESSGSYDSTRLNPWSTEEPFPVRISNRSIRHEDLIRKEAAARGLHPHVESSESGP
ncbi:Cytochrome P450 monooxygenase atE [Lachnellula suecica]|uniref:Cytochrome P450 monooxygenase atE n=1 Tax=Lachnellula suecica TaxID=602035 RepID=A0A8T9C3G5_9HELO|nr:Cytochrome P450 monooxygenase atE [Lachnellula suecica]